MYTKSIKKSEIKKEWWVVDVKDKTLGRISSNIAQILRGKHKVNFTPHTWTWEILWLLLMLKRLSYQVINLNKKLILSILVILGAPENVSISEVLSKYPERIIQNSVKGMLPHNKLGRKIFHNLKSL